MEEEVGREAGRVLTMVSELDQWLEAVGLVMTVGSIREQTSVVVAVGFDRKLVPVHVQPAETNRHISAAEAIRYLVRSDTVL